MHQPAQSPLRRNGPRPLPLHLLSEATLLMSTPAGLASLSAGSPPWKPHLADRAAELGREAAKADPDGLAAVPRPLRRRLGAFLRGIEAYRRHPYRRDLPEPPVLWREGGTRLLDFGADPDAPPVLMVPSLVNRYYILDLRPRRSLARYLAARGLRPLVVDWGTPGPAEAAFGLADYVHRLERMLDVATAGRRAVVLGYCMGGLLAVALAARRLGRCAGLALLATPWDFHAPDGAAAPLLRQLRPMLNAAVDAIGAVPVDALQAAFAAIEPGQVAAKFRAFAAMKPRSAAARDFVALEDWLNDGVPLTAPVGRECLFDWYAGNGPMRGEWRLGGEPVRPETLRLPSLVMIPARDRIVPPRSALALTHAIPQARIELVDAGHIGMVAGRRAQTKVYAPLTKWIRLAAMR